MNNYASRLVYLHMLFTQHTEDPINSHMTVSEINEYMNFRSMMMSIFNIKNVVYSDDWGIDNFTIYGKYIQDDINISINILLNATFWGVKCEVVVSDINATIYSETCKQLTEKLTEFFNQSYDLR